jgi:hypothetical protein
MRSRRVYTLWIEPQAIVELFSLWNRQSGCFCLPQLQDAVDDQGNKVKIPFDVAVEDACHDWSHASIGLRISHPSFPEVADGMIAPSLRLMHVMHHVRRTSQDGPDSPTFMEADV